MYFAELSAYFEKLEATSSRLALIDILSDLFKKAKGDEIAPIIYLTQGRVAPFFAPIEIGMAEKTVAQAVARAYGSTKEKVLGLYGKLGDMGLAAQQLSEKRKAKSEKLSVREAFETLTTIAHVKGEGTVEKRLGLLSDLLKKVDAVSAKHLVRVPLGTSRLGIGDPTVLDGLALAILRDRTKRKLLEKAYNETSDLGLIGQTLKEKGLSAVQRLKITVGRPIRSELCERLPNPEKVIEKMKEVSAQYKFDGFRCVTGFTPVYVQKKGVSAIRDIKVGDTVLTKSGEFKAIIAKQKRTIKQGEKLFAFKTFLGEEVKITEGHPILCLVEGKEIWKLVEEIKPDDEVVFPLPRFLPNNPHPAPESLELQTISGYKKTFLLNENFYRFLGFWIGDGFTNDFHNTERIGLTFNAKKESKLADFYEELIKKNLHVSTITRYAHNGGLSLYWRDEPLKHWLSNYFRREWTGKMIPFWFSHVSEKNFEQFLIGWIESDGSIDSSGTARIITKERDLAAFAQMIALSHGIIVGLHYVRIKIKSYYKTYYQLIIPKRNHKARIQNGRLIVKILRSEEVKKRDPRLQLYDLQVQDEESFCVPMATLHNCQIHKDGNKVSMFSRNLEDMTHMFPELIEGTLKQVKAKTAILDTEALAYNPESEEFLPFQETTKRRRKHNIDQIAKKLPLRAFVFDLLYKDGKSYIDEPLRVRLEVLKKTIREDGILIVSKTERIKDPKPLGIMLDDAISKGLEGLVVKRVDSLYQAGGRNFNWVKLKRHSAGELHDTIDCVILGYIYGRGKRTAFGAGALLVGLYDDKKDEFVTVSKIGTGLSDEEWREIHKRADKIKISHKPARVNSLIEPSVWIKPEIVIEVLADEITRSPVHTAGATFNVELKEPGYALRFPRLVSFRGSDKRAEDATTVKELIEMYKQQSRK